MSNPTFSPQNATLLLIDHQVGTMGWVRSVSFETMKRNVQVVADAGGSPSQFADEIALQRMKDNGVVLTTTNQCIAELAQDWSSPDGSKLIQVLFEEVLSKL